MVLVLPPGRLLDPGHGGFQRFSLIFLLFFRRVLLADFRPQEKEETADFIYFSFSLSRQAGWAGNTAVPIWPGLPFPSLFGLHCLASLKAAAPSTQSVLSSDQIRSKKGCDQPVTTAVEFLSPKIPNITNFASPFLPFKLGPAWRPQLYSFLAFNVSCRWLLCMLLASFGLPLLD